MTALRKPSNANSPHFRTVSIQDFKPADLNKRVIAFLMDSAISLVIGNIFAFLILKTLLHASNFWIKLTPLLFLHAYYIIMPIVFGATFGKKALGLKIISSSSGLKVSFFSLLLRETLGRGLSSISFGLGYLWCRFNKDGKTWHDYLSGTKVVEYR